jgi:hypothetical protein
MVARAAKVSRSTVRSGLAEIAAGAEVTSCAGPAAGRESILETS